MISADDKTLIEYFVFTFYNDCHLDQFQIQKMPKEKEVEVQQEELAYQALYISLRCLAYICTSCAWSNIWNFIRISL